LTPWVINLLIFVYLNDKKERCSPLWGYTEPIKIIFYDTAPKTAHFYRYLSAAVVTAAATAVVAAIITAETVTAAEKNEDYNNNPGTTAKTRITAHKNASFRFTLYTMYSKEKCYR